jgi:diguanylate cyclase (GGDEF)-like protein
MLLAFMMIPGTRRGFENCFALEERKNAHYAILEQRDGVTGLYNKGHFMTLVNGSVCAAQSGARPLAFIMMNIDHFQKFNETWGYPEGDKMMIFLAQLVRRSLRENDVAAHYGGGEFGIVLPGGTMPSAVLVAERIRQTFEKQTGALGKDKKLTLSLGLAFLTPRDTINALLQRADEALERAKANGRNRTEFESAPAL